MNSKRLFLSLLLFLPALSCAYAQGDAGAAAVINEIKRANIYLYAESTDADWKVASENATTILTQMVDNKITELKLDISVDEILKDKKMIRANRGNLLRAFVYVPDPAANMQPASPVSAPPAPMAPAPAPTPVDGADGLEKSMLAITDFDQIKPFISDLQEKGKLLDYGKYATLPESETYLFVYSKEGKVVAALKKNSAGQINISTGQIDDVTNYKGCGAIWFRTR